MCKALKKQGHIVIYFSRIFLYFDLHTGLTLDVFSYLDTYGNGRLVTFARVGSAGLSKSEGQIIPLCGDSKRFHW